MKKPLISTCGKVLPVPGLESHTWVMGLFVDFCRFYVNKIHLWLASWSHYLWHSWAHVLWCCFCTAL